MDELNRAALDWLLDQGSPVVRYRVRTEILGERLGKGEAVLWALGRLPEDWFCARGLWLTYHMTALSECGLDQNDVPPEGISAALRALESGFACGCGDFMLLRALVMLGCADQPIIARILERCKQDQLRDGGFLCASRRDKLSYEPKGCYKAAVHALLLAAECHKKGVACPHTDAVVRYFARRNVFYRSDGSGALVLDGREGWRSVDVFYPPEPMRVGVQNIVEAFCALGYGHEPWLDDAWRLLDAQTDADGCCVLKGTLTKSYLPRERVGRRSQWATFYALLARKERGYRP